MKTNKLNLAQQKPETILADSLFKIFLKLGCGLVGLYAFTFFVVLKAFANM